MQRRQFLNGALASSAVVIGAGFFPRAALAEWPKAAFEAKDISGALQAAMGASEVTESGDINVKAPDIAENGAVVPITVTTSISPVEAISIIVEKNPVPLAAAFSFGENAVGYVATRIKMGKTSKVTAVVKSGGKLYSAGKEVKVTIGGCGG